LVFDWRKVFGLLRNRIRDTLSIVDVIEDVVLRKTSVQIFLCLLLGLGQNVLLFTLSLQLASPLRNFTTSLSWFNNVILGHLVLELLKLVQILLVVGRHANDVCWFWD
jgi:hypothetical protein